MKKIIGILTSILLSASIIWALNKYLIPISYLSPTLFAHVKPYLLPKGYYNQRTCEDLQDFFKGKSVAIVGPAASFEGSGYGKEIDSHDVVVRVNSGTFDDPDFTKDFGSRTDVLISVFHGFNHTFLNSFVKTWETTKFFVAMGFLKGDIFDNFFSGPQQLHDVLLHVVSIRATFCSLADTFFPAVKKIFPSINTGIASLVFLRSTQLKSLSIFGFDFYNSGYHKWLTNAQQTLYRTSSIESFNKIVENSAKAHNQTRQFNFFQTQILPDKRIKWWRPINVSKAPEQQKAN